MEVTETLDDVFYYISEYFNSIITEFRDFFFGFNALDYNAIAYIRFFFLAVPIIFAAFEALFDWILPTMFNLQPMGLRRFFVLRSDPLKVPEAKRYKFNFRPYRSIPFRTRYKSIKLTPEEAKYYHLMYQQKYNTTATPMQLKRFIALEGKNYNYVSSKTGLTGDKIKSSANGAASLGKGVSKNLRNYKEWHALHKYEKSREET